MNANAFMVRVGKISMSSVFLGHKLFQEILSHYQKYFFLQTVQVRKKEFVTFGHHYFIWWWTVIISISTFLRMPDRCWQSIGYDYFVTNYCKKWWFVWGSITKTFYFLVSRLFFSFGCSKYEHLMSFAVVTLSLCFFILLLC